MYFRGNISTMKKLKAGHYILIAFIFLIGLLIGSNYINKSNEERLTKNGIETIATITDIDVNNYKANELEGKFVENYVLTFQFDIDGKKVKSIRTLEKKDYARFFDRTLNVNDQISILYDPQDPKNNKLKALNQN